MLTAKPHIWLFSYLFCFRKIMLNIRANIKCFFVWKVLDNYKHSLFLQLCVSQNMTSVHKCSQTFSWTKKCVHFGRKKDICFPRTKYKMMKGVSDVFPSLHVVHSVDPVLLACCPAVQSIQSSVKLLAASLLLCLPRGQSKHCSTSVAPWFSLYFPRGQAVHDFARVDLSVVNVLFP